MDALQARVVSGLAGANSIILNALNRHVFEDLPWQAWFQVLGMKQQAGKPPPSCSMPSNVACFTVQKSITQTKFHTALGGDSATEIHMGKKGCRGVLEGPDFKYRECWGVGGGGVVVGESLREGLGRS